MRSTLLAIWLAKAAGLPAQVRDTAYWTAQLRYLGCTAHAHEVAVMFGDDIETRARTVVYDASNPSEVLRDALAHGLPGRRGVARLGAVASILAGGRKFAEMNFRSGCEAADVLAARLGMTQPVRDALACTFERWNGKGQPNQVKGERIPLSMRVVHLAHDAEALARLRSPGEAVTAIRKCSGRAYDPALVDEFLPVAADTFARLDKLDPWDAALACEPEPRRVLIGAALDEALEVAADFIDLKSPFTAGHSRQVAALAAAAGERAGLAPAVVERARLAAQNGCGLRPPKFKHRNGSDSGSLACVFGKAWVAPRLLGVDAVAFSAGQFADGHLVCLGSAFDTAVTGGGQVAVPIRVGGCPGLAGEDVDDVRLGVVREVHHRVDVLPPALTAAMMHQDNRSALEVPANPALVRSELRDSLRVPVKHVAHVELLSFKAGRDLDPRPAGSEDSAFCLNLCWDADHYQACRQAGEEAPPDHGDPRDRTWGTEGLDGPELWRQRP